MVYIGITVGRGVAEELTTNQIHSGCVRLDVEASPLNILKPMMMMRMVDREKSRD